MRINTLIPLCLSALAINGCVSYDQLLNYQNQDKDTEHQQILIESPPEIRIRPNDVLSIKVFSSNPETAAPFNITPVTSGENYNNVESMQLSGYLLDEKGTIDFPILGTMELNDMTITEAKALFKDRLNEHIKDPVVNIRILNFRVSVTGEVKNPGTFTVFSERISIPDALALAGDLTPHANRSNLLLVREENGIRSLTRLNLQSDDFFLSDYYYLKQNDLIYVEPIKAKIGAVQDQTTKAAPLIAAFSAFIAVLVAVLR